MLVGYSTILSGDHVDAS